MARKATQHTKSSKSTTVHIDYSEHRVQKKAVIYVGFPKSGKDTQTEPLELLGESVLVTGKHLKDLARLYPSDERYEPIRRGHLVDDATTVWVTKRWIVRSITEKPAHRVLHLNGVPRRMGQIGVIPFLQDRNYDVRVVWFTTPPEICEIRIREGRFEDEDPVIRANRSQVYHHETLPMLQALPHFGIEESRGTLLKIDNTHLTPEQTAGRLIEFLGLPYSVSDMFPQRKMPSIGQYSAPR